jgi:glyoxylase-like metal-dependent hydrolase (beta-lactamase superfamily II)
MRIGDLEVHVLADGESTVPGDFYGHHHGHHGGEVDENNVMHLPIAAFLVRTGGKTVLIDAGLGPVSYDFINDSGGRTTLRGGDLPMRLAELGVRPEDIDYVFPTHLHADHAGWVIQQTKSYFPNAIIRFGAGDWEENVLGARDPRFGQGMKDVNAAGRVELIERDGELLPGISAMHTPGHTAGHTSFILSSGDQRAIILGDIISCPLQLSNVEMEVVFDTDPKLAVQTRERIMREIDGDMLVGGPHFPGLRFGRVLLGEGKRYWS